MVFRLFMLVIGFSLAVAGGVSLIAFLNLITTGHGIVQYFIFILSRVECYLFFIGIFIIWASVYFPPFKR
jgi:hypothetical protein